jgi:hypothetical protein
MPRGVNLLDPEHVTRVLEVYGDDLYWLRLARIAIHAMWEHKIIDDDRARDMRREAEYKLRLKYDAMRAKPGRGMAKFGTAIAR